MLDFTSESPISFKSLAESIPGRRGRGVAVSTVVRWALRGRHGVRLESAMIGGRRFTSREAFGRWIAKLNPGQPRIRPNEHRNEIDKALKAKRL